MSEDPDASQLRRAKAHLLVDDLELPVIGDADRRHIASVLRATDGTPITATDGRGSWRSGVFRSGGTFEPTATVQFQERPNRAITIGVAIPKQDRPEWIVQKLTEVGIAKIVFIEADRSVVRWSGDRAEKKVAKLRRTAVEALQQSRGVWLPEVIGPVAVGSLLNTAHLAEPGGEAMPVDQDTFLVGPEGGWTSAEIAAAAGTVGLGPTILRVETAALFLAISSLSVV